MFNSAAESQKTDEEKGGIGPNRAGDIQSQVNVDSEVPTEKPLVFLSNSNFNTSSSMASSTSQSVVPQSLVTALFTSGSQIDAKEEDTGGFFALPLAAYYGYVSVVEGLLKAGTQVRSRVHRCLLYPIEWRRL